MLTYRQLYDAQTNTSDVEEIRDQKKETQWITWHSSSELSMFVLKNRVLKSDETQLAGKRRGACTHCGQLNEYPTLPTPLLPTPLSPIISFHISSWYQFIFVYVSFKNLILHIFRLIMIIIQCSGMFRNVPCSRFYRQPLLGPVQTPNFSWNKSDYRFLFKLCPLNIYHMITSILK